MQLTKELKQNWLDALKSGKFVQVSHSFERKQNHCCVLGVFCKINNLQMDFSSVTPILGDDLEYEVWRKNDDTFDPGKPDYSNVIPFIEKLETID